MQAASASPPQSHATFGKARESSASRLELALPNEAATEALAALLSTLVRGGDVIALRGDLGAGKTVFARAFIRARVRRDEDVPSPTFTLVQVYEPEDSRGPPIWHFDLFRLDHPEEVVELGIEEAFGSGICLLEWAERIEPLLPANRLDLTLLQDASADARRAVIEGRGEWCNRLREAGLV